MRKIVLAVITLTLTLTVMGQDFRKVTWGMSPNQVKSRETDELMEETSELLIYKTNLAEYDALLGYIFASEKLIRTKYIVTETHLNWNDYVSDYDRLNGFLKKKYGEPLVDTALWTTDSSLKESKSYWGHAISDGKLILFSIYSSSNTEISITLSAEDYKLVNEIDYSSTSAELKSIEEEEILKDF
jgi:hypothetical protein